MSPREARDVTITNSLDHGLREAQDTLVRGGDALQHDLQEVTLYREHLSEFPPTYLDFCRTFQSQALDLITSSDWHVIPRTRYALYQQVIRKAERDYHRWMHQDPQPRGSTVIKWSDAFKFWHYTANRMAKDTDTDSVRVTETERRISGVALDGYIQDFLKENPFDEVEKDKYLQERYDAIKAAIDSGIWPIKEKVGFFGTVFEIEDPNLFNFLRIHRLLLSEKNYGNNGKDVDMTSAGQLDYDITEKDVLKRLEDAGCFDKACIEQNIILFSLLAESVIVNPVNSIDLGLLLVGIAQNAGTQEMPDFTLARCIYDDICRQYSSSDLDGFPVRTYGFIPSYSERIDILEQAKRILGTAERNYLYPQRTVILPLQTLHTARAIMQSEGSSAFFEEIFSDTVEEDGIETLFDPKVRAVIYRVLAAAHERRKAEAGIIPVFADVYGYDKETAIWLEKYMQAIWASLIIKDDINDGHEKRDGQPPLYKKVGRTSASQSALLTILQATYDVIREYKDPHLAERFSKMQRDVIYGDALGRNLGWDDEKKVFNWDEASYEINNSEAYAAVAEILCWFAQHAASETGFENSGQNLKEAASLWGQMVLYLNDLEDIAMVGDKHDLGSDVAQKMSKPWWHFMNLKLAPDDSLAPDLTHDQATIAQIFDNLAPKRRFGVELDETDKARVRDAIAIGNKYLPKITDAMRPMIEEKYYSAKQKVVEALNQLPTRDERNRMVEEILNALLDEVWRKFCLYQNSKATPASATPF